MVKQIKDDLNFAGITITEKQKDNINIYVQEREVKISDNNSDRNIYLLFNKTVDTQDNLKIKYIDFTDYAEYTSNLLYLLEPV